MMTKKQNQPCYDKNGNFLGWFSPSVAVATFVLLKDKDDIYVAATQRGRGCPNNVGKWNCQCGFLDFGESTTEAAKREVFEEIGVKLDDIVDWKWIDKPDENENISHRFYAILTGSKEQYPLSADNSETDEVMDIQWILVSSLKEYNWAFGHDKVVEELIDKLFAWTKQISKLTRKY